VNGKGASVANVFRKEYEVGGKVGYLLPGASQMKAAIISLPVMSSLRYSLPLMVPECSLP
jgi:hypothetical protein